MVNLRELSRDSSGLVAKPIQVGKNSFYQLEFQHAQKWKAQSTKHYISTRLKYL